MGFGSVERVNGGMALDTGCSGSGVREHRSLPSSARTCNCKPCKKTVREMNRDFFYSRPLCYTDKKENKNFPHIQGNLEGIGRKVIYV
jgi:hypothetical protein